MTWTNITNAAVAAGAAVSTALMTALRDNVTALANRDAGAPKVQTDFQTLARIELSGDATADFTEFDGTAYDGYVFVFSNVIPATNGALLDMLMSTDGGSTFETGSSAYSWGRTQLNVNANPVTAGPDVSGTSLASSIRLSGTAGSGGSEDGFSGEVKVLGPHLAKETLVIWKGAYTDTSGNLQTVDGAGRRNSQIDIDAVRFLFSSGNLESGIITMYGLRND